MKTYIIEDKIINLKTKKVIMCYVGKDDYVHNFIEYCEGYKRPSYAQEKIKREMDGVIIERLDDMHGLEGGTWLHIYNIIEYVKGE